jgi:hypothetical protein
MQRAQPDDRSRHAGLRPEPLTRNREGEHNRRSIRAPTRPEFPNLLSDALVAIKTVFVDRRPYLLMRIAPVLPETEREIALRDALVAANAIPDSESRDRVIGNPATHG